MNPSKPTAPLVNDSSVMASDAPTGWSTQHSEAMPGHVQQFGAMPMEFEFGPTAQEFGALPDYSTPEGGSIGYEYSSSNIINDNMNGRGMAHGSHFNGDFEETVHAKTPGYHIQDADATDYHSSAVHNSSPTYSNHTYEPYGAQTPFQPSTHTFDAKTPYMAPTPYASPHHTSPGYADSEIPDLDLDEPGAQASDEFDPGPSPMEETFPTSRPPTPTPKSGPAKKTPTPRKAKTKAKAAIASKEDEDTDEGRSLLSSRGKVRGKAKAVIPNDEDKLEHDDGGTPAAGSPNKGKGRKRIVAPKTPKTPTPTPSKKSKTGTAANKSTKKTTAVDLSTMGHQRVRKVSLHLQSGCRTCTKLQSRHPRTVLPKSSPFPIHSTNATMPIRP